MKKLNNKGITTIEVIISFVLIIMITSSLYNTISTYNEKRQIESYKSRIYTYKNDLTKKIQDDFIKIGLTQVSYVKLTPYSSSSYTELNTGSKSQNKLVIYQLDCSLKDGTTRRLVIYQRFTKSSSHPSGSTTEDDYFMILYGTPDLKQSTADAQNKTLIEYPLPNVGTTEEDNGRTSYDLSINNILVSFGNDSLTSNNNVLNLYIGFYHPELSTRYGINIISPIDYATTSSDGTRGFSLPTPTVRKYVVYYSANGGTGSINPTSVDQGVVTTLPTTGFKRAGYDLVGFSTTPSTTTPEYSLGQKVRNLTDNASITLYAIWEKREYTYTYTGNVQTLRVETPGRYRIEAWGAGGGGATRNPTMGNHGGMGGYAATSLDLKVGDMLYVYVGKEGEYTNRKVERTYFTGGEKASASSPAGTGGGASYVSHRQTALTANNSGIVLIAAGGGGAGGGPRITVTKDSEFNSSGGSAISPGSNSSYTKPYLKGQETTPAYIQSSPYGTPAIKYGDVSTASGGAGYMGGTPSSTNNSDVSYAGASGGMSMIYEGVSRTYEDGTNYSEDARSRAYKLGSGYVKIELIS